MLIEKKVVVTLFIREEKTKQDIEQAVADELVDLFHKPGFDLQSLNVRLKEDDQDGHQR